MRRTVLTAIALTTVLAAGVHAQSGLGSLTQQAQIANKNFDIAARMDNRINCGAPTSSCGFVLSNVSIHDNTLNGGVLAGCGLAGVTCTNNH